MYRESANVVIAILTKAYGIENDEHFTGDVIEDLLSKAIGADDFEYLPNAISFMFPNCSRANNCVMLYERIDVFAVEFNMVDVVRTEINGYRVGIVNPFTARRIAVRHGVNGTQLLTAFEQFTGINAYGDGQPVSKSRNDHFEYPPMDSPFPTDLSFHRTLSSFYDDNYHQYGEMMFLSFSRWRGERCDLVADAIKKIESEHIDRLMETLQHDGEIKYYDVPLVLREAHDKGISLMAWQLQKLFGILNDTRRRRYANNCDASVAFTGRSDGIALEAFAYVPGKSNTIDILENTDWFGFKKLYDYKDDWFNLNVLESLRFFVFGCDDTEFPTYAMCSLEELWCAIVNDYNGSDSPVFTHMKEYYDLRCRNLMHNEIIDKHDETAKECIARFNKSRSAGVHCVWAFGMLHKVLSWHSFVNVLVSLFSCVVCKSGNRVLMEIVAKLQRGWKDDKVAYECLEQTQDWIWDNIDNNTGDDMKCAMLLRLICSEATKDIHDIEKDIWLAIESCLSIGEDRSGESIYDTMGCKCLKKLSRLVNPFKGY